MLIAKLAVEAAKPKDHRRDVSHPKGKSVIG